MLIICNMLITYFTYLKIRYTPLCQIVIGKKLSFIILFVSATLFSNQSRAPTCQAQKHFSVAKGASGPALVSKKRTASKMLTAGIYKTATMIAVLTKKKLSLRTVTMIVVLIKMSYF